MIQKYLQKLWATLKSMHTVSPEFTFSDTPDCWVEVGTAGASGTHTAALYLGESDGVCALKIEVEGQNWQYEGLDYYACFQDWRAALAQQQQWPLCWGAAENAWPSGMLRQMSRGTQVYRLYIGKPADMGDIISIFEPTAAVVFPDAQRAYYDRWRMSC